MICDKEHKQINHLVKNIKSPDLTKIFKSKENYEYNDKEITENYDDNYGDDNFIINQNKNKSNNDKISNNKPLNIDKINLKYLIGKPLFNDENKKISDMLKQIKKIENDEIKKSEFNNGSY